MILQMDTAGSNFRAQFLSKDGIFSKSTYQKHLCSLYVVKVVAHSAGAKILARRASKRQVSSSKHIETLAVFQKRGAKDNQLFTDLADYFENTPDQHGVSVLSPS